MRLTAGWTAGVCLVTLVVLAACIGSAPGAAPALPTADTALPVATSPLPTALPLGPTEIPLPTAPPSLPTATPPPTAPPLPTATPTVIVGINNTAKQLTVAQLVRVSDGNTIEVKIKGQPYRVRYLGIEPLGDGTAAAAKNKQLVTGQALKLQRDTSDADAEGNLLRYVWAKTYMVNAELARLGFARAAPVPPDTVYQKLFQTMEQEARSKKRGLWAPGKLPAAANATPRATSAPGQ